MLKAGYKYQPGRQTGLSLIELLVSLGLGLFIVAGIFQVTVGSRQAFEVIEAQSMAQESGRFGTYFISDSVRNAGYINLGDVDALQGDDFAQALMDTLDFTSNLNALWPAEGLFVEGATVAGSDNALAAGMANAKSSSDLLVMRMQGDASYDTAGTTFSMTDCQGSMLSTDQNTRTHVSFYVSDSNNLVCRADQAGAAGSSTAVELVSGVEEMQIVYGVDTVAGTSFLNAASMTATDWASVSSVRVALLTASDNTPLDRQANSEFRLLDQPRTVNNDGKMRQVFDQTIALRNN